MKATLVVLAGRWNDRDLTVLRLGFRCRLPQLLFLRTMSTTFEGDDDEDTDDSKKQERANDDASD